MKVSFLLALSLVLLSAPAAWGAGEECTADGDCGADEVCSLISDARVCAVRGGLGSTCDTTTTCGEHLACLQGICTFSDDNTNNGTSTDPTLVIPPDAHCEIFDFQKQCVKDYFCNPLSLTCESATIKSCTVTDLATPGTGCKPTQWCTPIDEANAAPGADGACITITADPNANVCTPACPTGQTCALGICINDNVGNQCDPACPTGKICVANVCTLDTGSQCTATTDCATGKSCIAGFCVTSVACPAAGCGTGQSCVAGVCVADAACPTEGCGAGKTCIAGVCVADANSCPAAGCGTGKSCVAGVCVADVPVCPTEGCGTGKTCIAGVCVADANTCPTEGCGTGKSCVAGVCVADAVVPATCSATKPCTVSGQTCVSGVCTPGSGAQNVCSPACTTGNTCLNSVCVADGTAFTGTLGSRCDTTHSCNTNLACFAGFCVPSNLAAQAGGASTVHATVSILVSLAITCVAALMTV